MNWRETRHSHFVLSAVLTVRSVWQPPSCTEPPSLGSPWLLTVELNLKSGASCVTGFSHFVLEVGLHSPTQSISSSGYEAAHSFLQVLQDTNMTGFLSFHSHKILQGKLLDSVLLLPSSPSSKGKVRCTLKAALSRPEEQVFLSSCSLRLWWAPQWESGLRPLLWRSNEKQPSPLTELWVPLASMRKVMARVRVFCSQRVVLFLWN